MTYERANPVQRLLRRFAATKWGSWLARRGLHPLDGPIYRWTNGRHTLSSLTTGMPVLMLTTTGARSGKRRTVLVLGLPTPGGIAVIASNYGQRRHPAWYYNLRANPEGEVTVDGVTRPFRAVEAKGERRERLWRQGLETYPGWSKYESRASNREICVFVLETADGGSGGS